MLAIASAASLAAADPIVRFEATRIQGDVCVAPCAVHFDAIGDGRGSLTYDPQYDRPFHSLHFAWRFEDPTAGTWPISGLPQNMAIGAIAGHLYETPGVYDVSLQVTNPAGATTKQASLNRVVVADPDVVFAPTATWCFANSGTPGGAGFEECPVRQASQHVVIGFDATGFEDALTRCGARTGKSRCLFRAGSFFGMRDMVQLSNAPGPGLISRFGTGPDPIVYGSSGFLILRHGWTVAHLDVWLNGGESGPLFLISAPTSGVTVFDVTSPFLRGACFESASNDAASHSDRVAIIGVECHGKPTSTTGGVYLRAERVLLMGSRIENGYQGQFNVRTVHFPRSVLQHSLLERPGDRRNPLQLRAWSGSTSGSPIGPPPSPTEFVIVSDNVMRADNAESVIRTCQSNDCTDTPRAPGIQNLVFERNFASISVGSGLAPSQMSRAFWLQGGQITVRNNILDLQGLLASHTQARNRLADHSANLVSAPSLDDDAIHVLNNTVYYDDPSPNGFEICGGGNVGTGLLCRNNLIYVPNESGPRTEADAPALWSATGNLFATQLPFAAPVPDQGQSQLTDFGLSASSAARNAGWDPRGSDVSIWSDAEGRCRPEGSRPQSAAAAWDIGAVERGSGVHCLVTPEPGTALMLGAGLAMLARRGRSRGGRELPVRPIT